METLIPSAGIHPQSTGERANAPRAVIVTVHGTFAKGARWAMADSMLARALLQWFADRGGTATVRPFQWSGRNSIAARHAAGAALAECLDQIRRDDPQTALYVVAHSHGGSVFAYAMKLRPALVDKVDGFVALATPWLGLELCSYSAALRQLLGKLKLYTAFVASLFTLPSVIQLALRPAITETTAQPILSLGPITVPLPPSLLFWIPFVAAPAIGLILFFPLQRLVSRRLEAGMAAFQRELLNIAQDSSTLHQRLPPSVFLKPIGDEAALALTWTSAMTAVAQTISTLVFVSLQWVRDRWMGASRTVRIIGSLLLIAVWSMGTMELEVTVFKILYDMTMPPIRNIR